VFSAVFTVEEGIVQNIQVIIILFFHELRKRLIPDCFSVDTGGIS
jgi:hypothetical protein